MMTHRRYLPPAKRQRGKTVWWLLMSGLGIVLWFGVISNTTQYDDSDLIRELEKSRHVGDNSNGPRLRSRHSDVLLLQGFQPARADQIETREKPVDVYAGLSLSMRSYLIWHQRVRAQFPASDLLNNLDAPGVIVILSDEQEAIVDMISNVHKLVEFAARANRVILLGSLAKTPLEQFLQPVSIDWTVPYDPRLQSTQHQKEKGFLGDNLNSLSLPDAMSFVAEHKLVVMKTPIPRFVRELDVASYPVLGDTWRALFRPSTKVQSEIDTTMDTLGLQMGGYSAVQATYRGNENALRNAVHAVKCSQWLSKNNDPIYFFANNIKLVQQMTHAAPIETASVKSELKELHELSTAIVARDMSIQENLSLLAFFVDLHIGSLAQCLTYGESKFGRLVAMLAQTSCLVRHEIKLPSNDPVCPF